MSVKNLEALGRTYHGGAPFDGGVLNARCAVELVQEALGRLEDSASKCVAAFRQAHAEWLVMAPERARRLRAGLAYEAVRRKPGRSKLAAPGTRRKRNGGHRTGRRRP